MEVEYMARPERPVTNIRSSYRQQQEIQHQRALRRKRHLMQRLIIVGTAFMVLFGVMITFHLKQRSVQAELQSDYEELNEEWTSVNQQQDNLQEEIDLLNDEEYILDIARTNYFLSKDGELIFQMDDQDERTY